jgi:MYXO-CTERM domain-containing protein
VILKALCCSMLLFVAVGVFGIWLRRRRSRP